MFTKACEYAIKAMIFIAIQSQIKNRTGLNEIAIGIDSPLPFTAKILQKLVKSKLIESQKGPSGGFAISEDAAASIRLSDIVTAIDGTLFYNKCALGFDTCNDDQPCSLHYKYKDLKTGIKEMIEQTTLADLTKDISSGLSFLKRPGMLS